jgi:hypothetical protein
MDVRHRHAYEAIPVRGASRDRTPRRFSERLFPVLRWEGCFEPLPNALAASLTLRGTRCRAQRVFRHQLARQTQSSHHSGSGTDSNKSPIGQNCSGQHETGLSFARASWLSMFEIETAPLVDRSL